MTNQPTLARPAADAPFFYVQVCADQTDATVEVTIYAKSITAKSFHLAHIEQAENCEECDTCIFAVYVEDYPAHIERDGVVGDMLSDLYTISHLVDAPIFDIDDLTDTPFPNNLDFVD